MVQYTEKLIIQLYKTMSFSSALEQTTSTKQCLSLRLIYKLRIKTENCLLNLMYIIYTLQSEIEREREKIIFVKVHRKVNAAKTSFVSKF